jgi:hypothetical protein
LAAGLVERGAFFAFFCLEGTFSELLAGGLGEAAFGAGLGDALDDGDDLSDDLGRETLALGLLLGAAFLLLHLGGRSFYSSSRLLSLGRGTFSADLFNRS